MVDLTISIINYKTKDLTSYCISGILKQKITTKYEVWLIDNASVDDSVEFFKKNFPQVKVIESEKNLGFAGGHNLALRNITTQYVLILNSDTLVLDNTIDSMVDFMEKNQEVGVSSCKILNFDGTLQPNAGDAPFGLSLINWLFNLESLGIKKPSFHRNDPGFYEKPHEVGWVSGSFMLVKKEVFDKIGFLNDDFFMYFEDAEFCYRASKKGFKIMINPSVSIKHLSGGSLKDPKFRQWAGEYKGLIRFYQQQLGVLPSLVVRSLIYLSIILRIVAFSLLGKLEVAYTYGKVITSF